MTTQPTTPPQVSERTELSPPYAVILHNGQVNSMAYVVESLLECVPELTQPQAADIMLEAHGSGRALVIVCPLEMAETYRNCLRSRGLTATIEQA